MSLLQIRGTMLSEDATVTELSFPPEYFEGELIGAEEGESSSFLKGQDRVETVREFRVTDEAVVRVLHAEYLEGRFAWILAVFTYAERSAKHEIHLFRKEEKVGRFELPSLTSRISEVVFWFVSFIHRSFVRALSVY